jgi:fumarate hydratase, class II
MVMGVRKETDGLGEVDVPSTKLWGAQTQRSLEHFNIGKDLIPHEMIAAYATLKKAAANANHTGGRLDGQLHRLIAQVCDEILAGSTKTCRIYQRDVVPAERFELSNTCF